MKTISLGKPHINEPLLPLETFKQTGQFLVYYDGSAAALAALKTAISLGERGTEITAVSFVPVPRSQPLNVTLPHLETRAKVVLAAAVTNAALLGIAIGTEIIQCHAIGPALVGRAADSGATAIFLGIEGGDDTEPLNSVAEYVLCFARPRVVLLRL